MSSIRDELTPAPRMIEDAYKFCLASEILAHERNLMKVSQINAALSIEIILKSFFSVEIPDYSVEFLHVWPHMAKLFPIL